MNEERIKLQAKPPKGMSPATQFKGENRVLVYLLGRNLLIMSLFIAQLFWAYGWDYLERMLAVLFLGDAFLSQVKNIRN